MWTGSSDDRAPTVWLARRFGATPRKNNASADELTTADGG
jgi:hypothetical protein